MTCQIPNPVYKALPFPPLSMIPPSSAPSAVQFTKPLPPLPLSPLSLLTYRLPTLQLIPPSFRSPVCYPAYKVPPLRFSIFLLAFRLLISPNYSSPLLLLPLLLSTVYKVPPFPSLPTTPPPPTGSPHYCSHLLPLSFLLFSYKATFPSSLP